jgi:hypothetical protein
MRNSRARTAAAPRVSDRAANAHRPYFLSFVQSVRSPIPNKRAASSLLSCAAASARRIARQFFARGVGLFLETKPRSGRFVPLVACSHDARCAQLPLP